MMPIDNVCKCFGGFVVSFIFAEPANNRLQTKRTAILFSINDKVGGLHVSISNPLCYQNINT